MTKYRVEVDNEKTVFWYKWKTGELHREDGPAVEWADGNKQWYLNNECHRIDGPACEWSDGSKIWYVNGKLHREDGPACEYINGKREWWLHGELFSKEEWKKRVGIDDHEGKTVEIDGMEYELRRKQ